MLKLHTCIGYGGAKDWGSMAPDAGCVQCDYHRKTNMLWCQNHVARYWTLNHPKLLNAIQAQDILI